MFISRQFAIIKLKSFDGCSFVASNRFPGKHSERLVSEKGSDGQLPSAPDVFVLDLSHDYNLDSMNGLERLRSITRKVVFID